MATTKPSRSESSLPFATAVVALAIWFAAPPALGADKPDPLNDTWELSLGTYGVNPDTKVRVDGKAGEQGTKIDWEKTFGGGSLTRFRLDAQWRFADRHKFQAMWFNSSRSKTSSFDRDIEWNGEIYPASAEVKGTLDYDLYLLDYEYSFLRRETYEVAASLGAYYAHWTATLDARIADPTGGTNDIRQKSSADLATPLPVLGLRGIWVLPYDLSLDMFGQWFYLTVNEYSGNLQDYQLKLTWQPKSWLGLGIGYDWFSAHGDVDRSDFRGSLDWSFNGLMLYYSVSF
jgi:hypothetical protein